MAQAAVLATALLLAQTVLATALLLAPTVATALLAQALGLTDAG